MTESTRTTDPDPATDESTVSRVTAGVTTPLRVTGFFATVIGAALMGVGALLQWLTVDLHSPGDVTGVLNNHYKGIDTRNGKMALAAAAVLLVGVMILRVVRSGSARKVVAIAMIAAAVGGLAYTVAFLVDAGQRYLGNPGYTAKLGIGVLITLAGAVVGLLGAILDLAWAVSPQPASTH